MPGAHAALSGLYGQRLALPEVLQLLSAQLDYEARIGAWGRITHEVMTKVQLAELMPTRASAHAQAILALAAQAVGRLDFRDWLRARATLLADPAELIVRRPILADLWPQDPAAADRIATVDSTVPAQTAASAGDVTSESNEESR